MDWEQHIIDTKLFDAQEFADNLASGATTVAVYKDQIINANQILIENFVAGNPIKDILYKRAWFIDQLLTHAWQTYINSNELALLAVGGYGRRELHPHSDIDIMILTQPRPDPESKANLAMFLTFLWDIGLEVGSSVRTVKECLNQARADITVATNIMESRLITGNQELFDAMCKLTGPDKIWPTRKFFEAKFSEQQTRHQKYDDTEHNLEPNIKEGPGGLRDIQVIDWVAKRHFGARRLRELKAYGFLTDSEYDALNTGRAFLWRVRFALHMLTGRREDRLSFDQQRNVARVFGYESNDNSAIEQFMKIYYRTVRELNLLNEILLQHFQEAIIYARKEKIKPLNKRFNKRNDFLEASNKGIFKRYPFALLELFLLMQQTPGLKGVRASTIRLIRESVNTIDDDFRNDIRNKSLFMEILKQPRFVGTELRRMHRYGVLCAYLPVFAKIEGLMQFDLFHVYTVDEHILFVVRNLRQFTNPDFSRQFPLCGEILQTIPKRELLYLGAIFHDIAKGRGGHHSELGAEDALAFCKKHQLPDFDSKLVAWLVYNHLIMAKTAQRKDINDPEVINYFASRIGDVMHLQYLYLLTVADICGTNPKMWNNWKSSLMAELYNKTLHALRRGLENPIDKADRIAEVKRSALEMLGQAIINGREIEVFWATLGDDYFIRYSPDEIAWQTRAMARTDDDKLPLIAIQQESMKGGTGIFIYMRDHDNIFSRSTLALDHLRLNIVDARIITSNNGYTLDTFIVLEESGEHVKGGERTNAIKEMLLQELTNLDKPIRKISRMEKRQLRNFPIATTVSFSQDESNNRTVMEVIASDRVGLLSRIGMAMESCAISLQNAKIATYGEKVEDIFFITDHDNKMITDQAKLDSLRDTIIDALEHH
ncbi:MAG: glnD [Gammaproteobacteria bacterium]|nr:glnD [Gammaproteobacteria bacterium]